MPLRRISRRASITRPSSPSTDSARRPGSSLAKAVGTRIQSVETFEYPHSIGFLWEVFSGYLGFSHYDASKVMGLAAYGNPEVFRQQFLSILRTDEVNYGVAQEFLGVHPDRFARMEAMFGPPRDTDSEILPRHADMAAALQAATDAAVAALVRRVKRRVPFDNLCLAGGVALNCVTNELVRRSGEFSNVFIPSAPHDAGTAIGAAFAVHCAKQKRPPQRGNFTPYLGPAFKRRDILAAVKSAGLTARRSKSPVCDAADMIADGKIVAWFQGRMEFGPVRWVTVPSSPIRAGQTCAISSIKRLSTGKTSDRLRRVSWRNTPMNGSRLAHSRRVTSSCCSHVG
jgi:Predicted carbamoyl transferase, NodU family